MVDIAERFNEMIAELERTVNRIEGFAGPLTFNGDQSARRSAVASESVSESVTDRRGRYEQRPSSR